MDEKIAYYFIAVILITLSIFAVYKTLTTDPYTELRTTQQVSSLNTKPISPENKKTAELFVMTINDKEIQVEIADNANERAKGLSGRQSLAEDTGMLFLYDHESRPAFWMYKMNFPLDMIWIRDEAVVDITENVPPPDPDTPKEQLPRYSPSSPVDTILEVNAGFVRENDIQIGDQVVLPESIEN